MTQQDLDKLKKLANDPKLVNFCKMHGFKIPPLEVESKKSRCLTFLDQFITEDPDLLTVKRKIEILSEVKKTIPVLIVGETGTGKELLAQALHGERKGNFVAVNCAGVPDTLLESEFFGAVRGSYTGCIQDRIGYFEHAKDGTLFLDEVSELPLLLQSKLLRVLESKKFRRVGDVNERLCSCRIISATNILNLQEVKSFRKDLYYRLAGITLKTKSLKERVFDIQTIVVANDPLSKIPEGLIQKWITEESWSGNVRELKNKITAYLELDEI